jgi:hypothetical protein
VLGTSYVFTHVHTTLTGLLFRDGYQAAGGLPAETVTDGYGGGLDMPTTVGGLAGYAEGTDYDAWGRVLHEQIGNTSGLADITNVYNPHDETLKSETVSRETTTPSTVDTEAYAYDAAGEPHVPDQHPAGRDGHRRDAVLQLRPAHPADPRLDRHRQPGGSPHPRQQRGHHHQLPLQR